MSNCCKTRSSSLPSRGGLICAFHSYFPKQNNNKSSPRKVPWLERPFLLWLPGIKGVSILEEDGVMSLEDAACLLNAAPSKLEILWRDVWFHYFQTFVAVFLTFCSFSSFLFFCLVVIYIQSMESFLSSLGPKTLQKARHGLQFVLNVPTVIRAQACSSDRHHGQKEPTKFASLPARCYSVWKLIQTSSLQVSWQCRQKYICLAVGGHPGFSPARSAFLFLSLLAW